MAVAVFVRRWSVVLSSNYLDVAVQLMTLKCASVLTSVVALLSASSLCRSAGPLAQEYRIVWHNTDHERYVEGCGLARLDDGALVAVVPVVPRLEWSKERRVEQSRLHVVRSDDRGQTWQPAAELSYYSGVPWTHKRALYLFANEAGTEFRNDNLVLLRSLDGGRTWSPPVTLFVGHYWNCHTAMVVKNDVLYWAVDDLSLGSKRGPCAIAGDLTMDPMDPKAWRISKPVPFAGVPDSLTDPNLTGFTSQYLEPNVIEVAGKLQVLATVKPKRQSTANLCALFDLSDNNQALELTFRQYSPMPGGQLKFCVIRDDVSKLFWATANLVVDSHGIMPWWNDGENKRNYWGGRIGGNDRRFLMLLYSLDGLNWFQAGCIAQAKRISQSFMYARPVIDGDDLAIISRTSIDAPNQHDADFATFHRVRNFRQLALDLYPESGLE
ncbi:MAG TPA: sialidase family protein [Pirellulales bacterium]|nr:sialidase family protein [Pirellulales bacterium]